jgi:anti-anti-sigma factor
MPFTCICDRQSEVAILRCAGSIVVGDDTDYFHRAMADAAVAAQGIVVDLERVTSVDSSGLGSLIRACNIQTVQRRPVAFLKPSKRVLELIRLTGVDKVLKLFDDEPAAVQHAGGPARAAGASTAGGTPILCVEPDPPMQACLTALLEAGGFKVTAVRSAYDARMMGSSGADLVVLGPGLNADAKAAARSTLARAKHFVNVPPEFAAEQSEEAMRKLVSEVAAAAGRG